ncbi:response regulator transcription factor [Sedimentibacter hydroxybenzoicus DSM 7310]|uniref:Response regulator transcription factor n=1 Tax=Sedimentibacter hydroxybenzoicus DSM 7310 TaxID=1123245 RepID=A0A974BLU3_SEDHY|nr:response regulator transcription factor [Sedimentibacter hydroxybenzoicus]NYB75619.1 response regulator transcription factor [Sedimentibacter hydroxybenzoicus DSM 7310]
MKVLVVEDEADIRNLIKIALESEGYLVNTAVDGIEALKILKEQDFDLAVLDVMMPRLDGFNLLRKIREGSTIPVIFLTARADDMDKVLGLEMGADDYVSKPFSMNELLARVKAQLRRNHDYLASKDDDNNLLQYGDLAINADSCCAYVKNEQIELNAKEYKLLLHLMENPERVFTKKQLYNAVWDDDYYYDDNTIMVHISHLRNKIEIDPQDPEYIKTIRGIGYKLHKTGVHNER